MVFLFDLLHFADALLHDNTAADVMVFKTGFLVGGQIFEQDLYRRVALFLWALGDGGADVALLNLRADFVGVIVTDDLGFLIEAVFFNRF